MKIAQVAPLYESVPPKLYGGTERIVSYLTEELVRQGHDVTLFASGDSTTSARLIAPTRESLRLLPDCVDRLAHHILLLEDVARRAHRFDVIHFHVDYLHFPLSRRMERPHVTTLHGRLDIPDLVPLYQQFREMPLISISDAQRSPLPWVNWQATVHHGLPEDLYRFGTGQGGYLAFVGRISPEKRVDRAIEIARRAGMEIRIAAKVDDADRSYYEEVEAMLHEPGVEFLGEVGDSEKGELIGNASALLFPIDWPEPFGLVMIEALACGTPVIAWRSGSAPEVISDGETGFVVDDLDEAIRAVELIPTISRERCRAVFEERFSVRRMAKQYVAAYRKLADDRWRPARVEERSIERVSGGTSRRASPDDDQRYAE